MDEEHDDSQGYVFRIDGLEYRTTHPVLTAAQIRALPLPPIGPDHDLWLVRADGPDEFLTDSEEVDVSENPAVFTAPRAINPGR